MCINLKLHLTTGALHDHSLLRVSNRLADIISGSFQEIFLTQSSRIRSVIEMANIHFIAVLADTYQAGLLTPRSHQSWFTVTCFRLVTRYTNNGTPFK